MTKQETKLVNPFELLDKRLESIEKLLRIIANQRKGPEFYSPKEVSNKLGVSLNSVYRGISSGKIPSKKIGSRTVVHYSFFEQ